MPIDYSKYPPNWKSEIRPRILQRENNCCKFCYAKNYELVFRGKIKDGREVYQYADGSVFLYPSGKQLLYNYYNVHPISGNPNQKAIKIILTIAHLDHDEDNHNVSDDRLAALCQKCHLSYDKEEKRKRRELKKYSNSFFPVSAANRGS